MSTFTLELKFLKYFEIAKVSYLHATAYAGDVLSLGVLVAIRVWVLKQLYVLAYNTGSFKQIGGLTVTMTIWSLAFTNSFQLGTGSRMVLLPITEDIQTGNIAHILTKPYSFLSYLYFANVGRIIARLIPTLFLAILTALILVGPINFTWQSLAAGLLLSILGLSLNLVFIFIIGILGFWVEEVKPFRWILDRLQWVIGGMVIPLSFFPPRLQSIAEVLPFAQVYYAPARILVGFDSHFFIKFLLLQIIWLTVSVALLLFLFNKGVKNISINGG